MTKLTIISSVNNIMIYFLISTNQIFTISIVIVYLSSSTRPDDGFLSMGNNPMVGATVAIAVAIQQAMN